MIPIVWTAYTAVARGRVVKLVPCEGCGTEYVYVLERAAAGGGTSLYLLDDAGAKERAAAGAEESLREYLANDFDPVPCPACGHYQRHMVPKLYDGGSPWVQTARLAALAVGCLAAVAAAYWGLAYLRTPGDRALVRLAVAVALLVVVGLTAAALAAADRSRARRFDPNAGDRQARIAAGLARAVTRAEFEATQRAGGAAPDPAV